jgi:hypothetical protein
MRDEVGAGWACEQQGGEEGEGVSHVDQKAQIISNPVSVPVLVPK